MENRHPSTIVARVVSALVAAGADAVHEYPGYIHLQTELGAHYATGTANATWTVDRLTEDHDTERSVDTEVPTTENDAPTIARAIMAAIQEDEA